MTEKRAGLSAMTLKYIAMATMLVDHMGYVLFPWILWLRCVGRIAFPIFAFQIAEGCIRTHDRRRYALRLLLLAIVSHFAYQFFSFGGHVGWRVFLPFAYGNVLNQTSVIWALLVYSLAKGKEENQPLVDKYIEMIDSIEQEIARLKASLTPAEAAEVDYVVHEDVPAEEPEAPAAEPAAEAHKSCPQCGAPVSDDALFCNKCGAQL